MIYLILAFFWFTELWVLAYVLVDAGWNRDNNSLLIAFIHAHKPVYKNICIIIAAVAIIIISVGVFLALLQQGGLVLGWWK